ncbi:hypothetical protein Noda2021_08480 [Candidatus Dependentiae bacterium Noda2021]|nr:hypothetical protein Noda2021_08480 [Candidatus Dependentiae bacterium Noda2021]
MTFTIPRFMRLLLSACALASLCFSVFFVYRLVTQNRIITANTTQYAQENAQYVSTQIEHFTQQAKNIVQLAANQLTKNSNADFVTSLLTTKPIFLSGLGVIKSTPENNVAGWYFVERNDAQELVAISPEDLPTSVYSWINQAKDASMLTDVVDPVTGMRSWLTAQKITSDNNQELIIFATISTAHIKHLLSLLSTKEGGVWIITDEQGSPLVYPALVDFMAHSTKNLGLPEPLQQSIGTMLENHNTLSFDSHSQSWIITAPLPSLKAQLIGLFAVQQTIKGSIFMRHTSMAAVVSLALFCMFVLLIWFSRNVITIGCLWSVSIIATLIFSVALGCLWYIADKYPYNKVPLNTVNIRDKVSLYQFLDSINQSTPVESSSPLVSAEFIQRYLNFRYKKGRYVPTGIFITSLSFEKPHQIEIAGYVWQRYFDQIHDSISRGFLFPQAVTDPTIEEVSRSKQGNVETIIWQVNVLLNQQISYRNYPFDIKNINIQLWHRDFNDVITFVPDLDSYLPGANLNMPELSPQALLPGWYPIDTYFAYNIINRPTNFGNYAYGPFGIYQSTPTSSIPELSFMLTLKRNLLETMITELLPLFVIALLLFVLLITDRQQGYVNVITGASAIFFGTIVAHLKFREKIPPQEVAYFEIFFLIMYVFNALVLAISLLNLFETKLTLITYKNNIISHILYWPTLLVSIFLITLYYLY